MLLLLLAAQVATPPPAATPAEPTRFSILQPVGTEPCVRHGPAKPAGEDDDIVVCGHPLPSQKLPFPNEAILDEPRPSNPDMTGTGALALEASPCASVSGGCGGGLDLLGAGVTVVRLVQKLVSPSSCCEREGEATNPLLLAGDVVHSVKHAVGKKPDKSKRVAIALEDAPVSTEGKILP